MRGGQDLHIAATALVHRLPIATMNVADFMRINDCYPLPEVYDPLTDCWHTRMEPLADQYPLTQRNDASDETPEADFCLKASTPLLSPCRSLLRRDGGAGVSWTSVCTERALTIYSHS